MRPVNVEHFAEAFSLLDTNKGKLTIGTRNISITEVLINMYYCNSLNIRYGLCILILSVGDARIYAFFYSKIVLKYVLKNLVFGGWARLVY